MNQERVIWIEKEIAFCERGETYYLRPLTEEKIPVTLPMKSILICSLVTGVLFIAAAALFGGVR